MAQVDSISRVAEVITPVQTALTAKVVNEKNEITPKLENDKIEIPVKENNYDDPFGKKDKKTIQKDTIPSIPVKVIKKEEVINDEKVNDQVSNPPRIEIDMTNLFNNDDTVLGGEDEQPHIDIDTDFLNDEKFNIVTFTPVKLDPKTNKIIKTPVPKNLNSMVTTTYTDIRGENVKVRGDVVEPLNKLMDLADKQGIKVAITYSYRSTSEQTMLWNNAIKKYGSAGAARKWVAPPGRSRHNIGIAMDVTLFKDGKKISQKEFDQITSKSGFYRPMSWEGWHIEPVSTRKRK